LCIFAFQILYPSTMSDKKNAALGFIFITLLIDVIGIGIIIPVLPKLIEQLDGSGGGLSEASKFAGWLTFAYAVMQFIFSPLLGGLSDRYGRRPIILFSLLGLGIDYILMAYAPSMAWLFVGRLIAGIGGASFTTATAYIADISTPEKRSQNFGMLGVAFGVGFIIGPVIGGFCSQWGPRVPFLVAAAFSLLNLVYGYFVLPESLPKENRRAFDWKRANPIGSLMQLQKYPLIAGLIGSFVLVYIAGHAVQSNWSFYTMLKFDWTEQWVGYSLGIVGIIVAVVQGGLIRVIIPWLGQVRSVYYGLGLNVLGLVLFAYATNGWLMMVFLLPYALGGISGPAMQGIISNQVPATEQGELQGGLTSLVSITSIVGPLLMNNLFAFFTGTSAPVYFPGAPFLLGALLIVISLFWARRTLSGIK
jgi:DHA1 family tetracycline resistance protein-like MFS transporter